MGLLESLSKKCPEIFRSSAQFKVPGYRSAMPYLDNDVSQTWITGFCDCDYHSLRVRTGRQPGSINTERETAFIVGIDARVYTRVVVNHMGSNNRLVCVRVRHFTRESRIRNSLSATKRL